MANPSRKIPSSNLDIDITTTKGINFLIETGFNWLVCTVVLLKVAVLFWMSLVIFQQAYPGSAKF